MPNVCRARYSYNTTDEINEAKTMQLHPILDLFVFTFEKFYYIILLIRDMVVESWNRRFCRETIHPTKIFSTSMNLLQMPCMVT